MWLLNMKTKTDPNRQSAFETFFSHTFLDSGHQLFELLSRKNVDVSELPLNADMNSALMYLSYWRRRN